MFYTHFIGKAGIVRTDPTNNPENMPTLIGIASWVGACGYVEYPNIFGKVTHVLDWIKRKTSKHKKFLSTSKFQRAQRKLLFIDLLSFTFQFAQN